jgi:hypothetical protein
MIFLGGGKESCGGEKKDSYNGLKKKRKILGLVLEGINKCVVYVHVDYY